PRRAVVPSRCSRERGLGSTVARLASPRRASTAADARGVRGRRVVRFPRVVVEQGTGPGRVRARLTIQIAATVSGGGVPAGRGAARSRERNDDRSLRATGLDGCSRGRGPGRPGGGS